MSLTAYRAQGLHLELRLPAPDLGGPRPRRLLHQLGRITNCKGDIGQTVHKRGEVVPVKLLGTLAMIDEGETDWKIFAIDTRDPMAEKLNDIDDINTHMPGFIAATVEWFKIYKMPDGK